jgi:DNA-binding response OmpR family regulator
MRASEAPIPGFDPLPSRVACGPLEADRLKLRAKLDGISLVVTRPEFALLLLLMERANRAVRRAELLAAAWRLPGDHRSNVLDLYIGRLRRRLGACRTMIQTVGKYGYRLRVEKSDEE